MLGIIINPKSGKRAFRMQRIYLWKLLRKRHQPFTYRVTKYAGHAIELARELVKKGYKKENVIIIETDNGQKVEFRVLFTYHSEEYSKDYIFIYEEKNPDNLLVYSYDEDHNIYEIEDDEEFKELEEVLQAYEDEHSSNN